MAGKKWHQVLVRVWETKSPYIVGMENGITNLENSFAASCKTKHAVTIWPSSCTLGHLFQRNVKQLLKLDNRGECTELQ